jgi:Xaa-Pro aminopeptidase
MKKRIAALQRVLKQENLDCLLVTDLPQVRYLCGYTGTNGMLIVFQSEAVFITDFRYAGQVKQQVTGAKIKIAARELLSELDDNKRLQAKNLRVGYLEAFVPVKSLRMIKEKLPNALLAPTNGLVESLAVKKDIDELKLIQKAA